MTIDKFITTPTSLDVVEKVNEIIDALVSTTGDVIHVGPTDPNNSHVWIEVTDFLAVSGNTIVVSESEPVVDAIVWIEV